MGWRVLYIEKSEYLSCYLDNLKIENGEDKVTIPFSDIDSIILDNRYMNISVSFLNKCIDYKINLIICDSFHLPNSLLLPFSNNYQTFTTFNKQLKWQEEQKQHIWQLIVKHKIMNQQRVLNIMQKNSAAINTLNKYIEEVEINDSTNREGLAAKVYFRALFGNDFIRQNNDTINSCLNYGYTILRSQICRSLSAKGLNSYISIFHKNPNNSFNLADDIIEVFRPIIDLWVSKNVNEETLFDRNIRLKLVELTSKKINYENNVTILNAINIYIDKIINFFETGDISALTFPDIEYND